MCEFNLILNVCCWQKQTVVKVNPTSITFHFLNNSALEIDTISHRQQDLLSPCVVLLSEKPFQSEKPITTASCLFPEKALRFPNLTCLFIIQKKNVLRTRGFGSLRTAEDQCETLAILKQSKVHWQSICIC